MDLLVTSAPFMEMRLYGQVPVVRKLHLCGERRREAALYRIHTLQNVRPVSEHGIGGVDVSVEIPIDRLTVTALPAERHTLLNLLLSLFEHRSY